MAEQERRKFNPQEHLTDLNVKPDGTRKRDKDGRELPPLPYLEVKWRLVWLREERPNAALVTEIVQIDEQLCVFRARITDGEAQATGHGACHYLDEASLINDRASSQGWRQNRAENNPAFYRELKYIEKAETSAIGRALVNMGYGSAYTTDLEDAPAVPTAEAPETPGGPESAPAAAKAPRAAKPANSAPRGERMPPVTPSSEPGKANAGQINALRHAGRRLDMDNAAILGFACDVADEDAKALTDLSFEGAAAAIRALGREGKGGA